jgi:hypothetical protein
MSQKSTGPQTSFKSSPFQQGHKGEVIGGVPKDAEFRSFRRILQIDNLTAASKANDASSWTIVTDPDPDNADGQSSRFTFGKRKDSMQLRLNDLGVRSTTVNALVKSYTGNETNFGIMMYFKWPEVDQERGQWHDRLWCGTTGK